jgi:hypothetical protein
VNEVLLEVGFYGPRPKQGFKLRLLVSLDTLLQNLFTPSVVFIHVFNFILKAMVGALLNVSPGWSNWIHIDDVDKPSAGSVDRRCPYRSVVPIGSDCV